MAKATPPPQLNVPPLWVAAELHSNWAPPSPGWNGASSTNTGATSGGGGGGSGFGPPGVAFETGVREGHGVLTITADPAAGSCVTAGPAAALALVAVPRFTG
jgi:hypothetical protein